MHFLLKITVFCVLVFFFWRHFDDIWLLRVHVLDIVGSAEKSPKKLNIVSTTFLLIDVVSKL